MLPEKGICCAILAGGKAERLPDKPFFLLNGKPLVSRVIDVAYEYFDDVIIIAKKEQTEKIMGLGKSKKEIKIIIEDSNDFSPWNGIKAAVENSEAEWIFLLACDMPFVCAELFDLLVSKISPDIDCVIPRTDTHESEAFGGARTFGSVPTENRRFSSRLQPLCALYRRSALEKAPLEGSVTRFAESLKKEVVQISEKNAFWLFNINTKEDLEKAEGMMKNNTTDGYLNFQD